jgi:glycosyltransferase involved in cell wall biosynthesis
MSASLESLVRQDGRPVVLVYRSPVFNASEGFVQAQAMGLRRYQPVIVGLEDKGNVAPQLAERTVLAANEAERFAFRAGLSHTRLTERLRPLSPVLLHAHFGTDALLALPLARALGIPLVTTLHGYEVGRTRARMLASGRLSWMRYAVSRRRLMRAGDLFLPVSEAVRTAAVAQGFPAERIGTHYLGIDLERFKAEAAPERGLILHVGRLVEKKGTAVLLRALAGLPAPAQLTIVGDGPERARLERMAAELGVGARVTFLGALSRSQVVAWMRRAWVLAVPSLTARDGDAEGLPTVLLEAAATGLPAVGSRHSGIPEAIEHGRSGLLIPEGDAAALAEALGRILASPELQHGFGVRARALAEERFDLAHQIARLEERYDGLVGARARSSQIRP